MMNDDLCLLLDVLQAPVLSLWGVKDVETCFCPKGRDCGRNSGKHPHAKTSPNGVNSATLDKTVLRERVRLNAHGNWAIACGHPLPGGGYLGIIDMDPRNGGEESIAQIQGIRGELPETVTQLTGGGGYHKLFRFKNPPKSCGPAPGVEVLGVGKYAAVHSKHWSGGAYVWEIGHGPGDVPVADAPAWLEEAAAGASGGRPVRLGEGTARDTVLGEAFALAGMLGVPFDDGTIAVKCPWSNEHTDNRGRGEDSSTVILPPAGGSRFGGFRCLHAHCATRKWHEVLNSLPVSAVADAKRKYPLRPVEVNEAEVSDTPSRAVDELLECKKKLAYKTTKSGYQLVNDVVNAVTILTYDPRWRGILSFDEFSMRLRFGEPPPWHPDDAPTAVSAVWQDSDAVRLHCWFKRFWGLDVAPDRCAQAAYNVACKNGTHPLREWLSALRWDGVPRAKKWLTRYLGAEDHIYTENVGTWWLVSAVARAYQPGCKVDHVLILEGPQGRGKSNALRTLVGPAWFMDTPIDIGSKDAYLNLRGKWIVELAELSSLNRAEAHKAKAFFTSATDSYRPPYGRETMDVPRTCVFAGTVNPDTYLTDDTGNRRYWPVRCGVIDMHALMCDREKIWAEVVQLYNPASPASSLDGSRGRGQRWWPEGKVETENVQAQQTEREVEEPWVREIANFLASKTAQGILDRDKGYISASDILTLGLKMEPQRISQADVMRVGKALKSLGYRKVRALMGGHRVWVFRRDVPGSL